MSKQQLASMCCRGRYPNLHRESFSRAAPRHPSPAAPRGSNLADFTAVYFGAGELLGAVIKMTKLAVQATPPAPPSSVRHGLPQRDSTQSHAGHQRAASGAIFVLVRGSAGKGWGSSEQGDS